MDGWLGLEKNLSPASDDITYTSSSTCGVLVGRMLILCRMGGFDDTVWGGEGEEEKLLEDFVRS